MLYAPLFLLIIASIAITGVKADPAPYMFVDPPTAEISAVGQNITIKVNVTTVSNLYGYEFWLEYNSTLLTEAYITPDGLGQVAPSDPGFRAIDDLSTPGAVRYSLAFWPKPGPVYPPSFNGSGTLAWITFNGTAEGVSGLNFTRAKLFDTDGTSIITDPWVDGQITVIPEFPTAIIMPLFLIATLAATFLAKMVWSKKHRRPVIS